MIEPVLNLTHSRALAECAAAKAWRYAMGLTMNELAALTGYSSEAIFLFERGINSLGKPHARTAWRRYKLACLAVATMLHYRVTSVDDWQWQQWGKAA